MKILYTFLLTLFLFNFTLDANCNEKKIITTIKPIHSILLNIVDSDVELLLNNNSSPHDFKLKPSDIKKITDSDVLIYIDESIESFIERPLNALGEDTKTIKILGNADLSLLPIREGGVW